MVGQTTLHCVEQPLWNESITRQNLAPLGETDLVIWICDAGRLLVVVFDVLEGRAAVKQAVQDAAQRPNITFEVNLQV